MHNGPCKILDNSDDKSLLSVIDTIAKEIVRTYAPYPSDEKPPFNDLIYTLRALVIQNAYELLGQNKNQVALYLNTSRKSVIKYVDEGKIHVE